MAWDPEKYREKRKKVLGIKNRGISFGRLAALVSLAVLLGAAGVIVPNAVSFIKTRHWDDVIYRLPGDAAWPEKMLKTLRRTHGVTHLAIDTYGTRLVVTFDRRSAGPEKFQSLFLRNDLAPALLNRVNHRQHQATLANEKEAEGETP